ncbi:HisA/HisF-related TIM barrel protein [Nioella sediminis]|jgi:phosphoribosylformimino-5-aminoimidazole carboxamide ribotide isomerase|uniref:1-(5-phosphoribosyl)-5-[(5- phosphoribosylamino)methylideneamino]imidazole-4- carboxamide isomerase n=1 Tax=Nioella sediminis TaxID=1912092 RepID=UPI0008FD9093|nr:1-(5-phosphoribosyl)-5-[(5-phosphoribosylamino)methylideneamino] imidazole-4-carboxamide isomerase [Nioella sediminis]TBX29108.1 1-(5-phosphoribosyl)-5-[(5-phosphoribosylamino)methylideneamino] imidazole-4-carboxamide isomerase [Roseovarius sp. JS7-11]
MMIYPTIELQNGRCVSLHRGRIEEPQIWHVDPIAKAKGFAADGAEWMHVTDLDWVIGGDGNASIIEEIILHSGIPVQLGGGFRSLESIAKWIDKGAGRIVVSSLAAQNPDIVKQAAKRFPDQIVVAVDVFQGQLMTNGWRDTAAITPADFMSAFDDDPLAAFIVTDIDSDIEDSDGSLGVISQLADGARAPVIARGLSRSLDDIARLKYVPHISGAIIGRALFDKSIELSDALAVANARPGPTADFI